MSPFQGIEVNTFIHFNAPGPVSSEDKRGLLSFIRRRMKEIMFPYAEVTTGKKFTLMAIHSSCMDTNADPNNKNNTDMPKVINVKEKATEFLKSKGLDPDHVKVNVFGKFPTPSGSLDTVDNLNLVNLLSDFMVEVTNEINKVMTQNVESIPEEGETNNG